jgi:hypothetical protein
MINKNEALKEILEIGLIKELMERFPNENIEMVIASTLDVLTTEKPLVAQKKTEDL